MKNLLLLLLLRLWLENKLYHEDLKYLVTISYIYIYILKSNVKKNIALYDPALFQTAVHLQKKKQTNKKKQLKVFPNKYACKMNAFKLN